MQTNPHPWRTLTYLHLTIRYHLECYLSVSCRSNEVQTYKSGICFLQLMLISSYRCKDLHNPITSSPPYRPIIILSISVFLTYVLLEPWSTDRQTWTLESGMCFLRQMLLFQSPPLTLTYPHPTIRYYLECFLPMSCWSNEVQTDMDSGIWYVFLTTDVDFFWQVLGILVIDEL